MIKATEIKMNTNMDDFPEHLYYYTTLATAKKIIEDGTLWLGDYRFMNDENELIGCAKTIKDTFSQAQYQNEDGYDYKLSIEKIFSEIENILNGNLYYLANEQDKLTGQKFAVSKRDSHTSRYIFCLTKNRDDKNMWVLYGKKELGCRIKFNIKELNAFFMQIKKFRNTSYNPYIFCGKVSYDREDLIAQTKFLRNNQFWVGPEDPLLAEKSVFNLLISHKDISYKDEEEYRIVCAFSDDNKEMYSVPNKTIPTISKVYSCEGTYIKPFMQIDKLPIEKVISEIMISPYNKSEMAEIGLKDLIYHKKGLDIEVVHSGITIR